SVQDTAAQLAAPLLVGNGFLSAGARVLDACAAPGGKTAHLLEPAELDVLALDSDPLRLARVQVTLNPLHPKAELKAADARDTARWWDGRPFAAIPGTPAAPARQWGCPDACRARPRGGARRLLLRLVAKALIHRCAASRLSIVVGKGPGRPSPGCSRCAGSCFSARRRAPMSSS